MVLNIDSGFNIFNVKISSCNHRGREHGAYLLWAGQRALRYQCTKDWDLDLSDAFSFLG